MADSQRTHLAAVPTTFPQLAIRRGTCYAIYAFDVASSIDLDAAQLRIERTEPTERQTVHQKQRAPSYFEYRPAPLSVTFEAPVLPVAGFSTAAAVELVMYDFGAISLSFAIPITGPFFDLVGLASALRGNARLVAESKRQVELLMAMIGPAAERARIASLVEDYEIFEADEWDPPMDASMLYARMGPAMAQVLRAETRPLSDQEIEQATSLRGSFGPTDLTVIDTDAALVFDPDAEDVRAVIEFANAQILEMRFLDQQLDEVLERSYDLLGRQKRALLGLRNPEPFVVAQYQLDGAILFERVTNALKLIGEQYLTRIYGMVSRRFHLAEWDASITRKLQTLEGIYEKMAAQASGRRMEILEWIIIILFVVDIVLPFLTGLRRK
jgi:hypothetical protein